MGPPFTCRTRAKAGLEFPKVDHWPIFICECCTVRAALGRELGAPTDRQLLRLERARMLDVANSWSAGTYQAYKSKIAYLAKLEQAHPGLKLLARPNPSQPPVSEATTLAWAELAYSLRTSSRPDRDTVAFGTVRQLRSAAGWNQTIAAIGSEVGLVFEPRSRRLIRHDGPTSYEAVLTRFTEGLKRRLGDTPRPSYALLLRHVRAVDKSCTDRYTTAIDNASRAHWARAGLANVFLWLGWLRSLELFDLRWCDIGVILPQHGPRHDLPAKVGCLLLKLNPITKTSPHHTADVPIAYQTTDGFQPGVWFHRLRQATQADPDSAHYLFQHPGSRRWDSHYYRHEFLYPVLHTLRKEGDPYLAQFSLKPGIKGFTIEQAMYSLHCYRRGARTYVDLPRGGRHKGPKASMTQVYEHARWTRTRSGEQIDVIYRQWPLYERLKITLFNM